jgi:PAS domain S-box-containing protein
MTPEMFEVLVDSATDFAIFTVDPVGLVTSWNRGAERVTGYEASEILGQDGDVIFTEEDRAAGAPEWERETARRDGRAEDERWHRRRDGVRFWGSGAMMPLRQPQLGFVKVLRDRTEQHEGQRELEASERRFRLLATHVPQLVFRSLGSGSRTWGSPQWINFTGLSESQSLGTGWLDAIHPDDQEETLAAWGRASETGKYTIVHRILRASDGMFRWHQTEAGPIDPADPQGSDWVGTSTDIDDVRSLQDRQAVLLAELQHRTRNLLGVAQSVSRQTLRTSRSLDEFGRQFEGRLQALSRVQSLLSRTSSERVDLRSLVELEIRAHAGEANSRVSIEGPQIEIPAISAQALNLAVHELATNALKYGALAHEDGRLSVSWTLEETVESHVTLVWRERGVHIATPPKRKGYGSELIERALPYQLHASTSLAFDPDGVICTIRTSAYPPEPSLCQT